MCAVPKPVTQNADYTAFRDLILKPCQELAPDRVVPIKSQGICGFRLSLLQERRELNEINAEFAAVVAIATGAPSHATVFRWRTCCTARRLRIAGMACKCRTDQAFEASFGRVSCHVSEPELELR